MAAAAAGSSRPAGASAVGHPTPPPDIEGQPNSTASIASAGFDIALNTSEVGYWVGGRRDLLVGGLKTSLGNFLTFNLQLRGAALATGTLGLEPGVRALMQAVAWTLNNIPAYAVNLAVGNDHIPVKIRGAERDVLRHFLTEVAGPLIPAAFGMLHDMMVAIANHKSPGNFYGDPHSWSSFAVRELIRAITVNGFSAAGAGVFRENCRTNNANLEELRGVSNRNKPYQSPTNSSKLAHIAGYLKTFGKGLLSQNFLQSTGYAATGALAYAGLNYLAFDDYNPSDYNDPDEKYQAAINSSACVFGAICAGWLIQHGIRIVAGQRVFDNPTPPPVQERHAG